MNRFLTRKRPKQAPTIDVPPNIDPPSIPPLSIPWPEEQLWTDRTEKSPPPEQKVEQPIICLPSPENFRTSLIMPKLSARFSMLREQDNPSSPLGKASDDSVLQPQRRSRLLDLGHVVATLPNITETVVENSPLPSPTTPPRKASYTYGERVTPLTGKETLKTVINRPRGNTNGSSRSGEGAVIGSPLRQSPRRIKNLSKEQNDSPPSPYKRYRERQKAEAFLCGTEPNEESSSLVPQPLRMSPRRRVDNQSPTAEPISKAESIATPSAEDVFTDYSKPSESHRLERSTTKKLYDGAAEQQMKEQRTAAIARLNSIRRIPNEDGSLSRNPSSTVASLRGRFERQASDATKRTVPDLELDKLTTFESLRAAKVSGETIEPAPARLQSGDPFDDHPETADVLYEAMLPGDRGKATAMATFKKPLKFDEHQYLQRQLSLMQQQRKKRRSVLSPKKATFPKQNGSPIKMRPLLAVDSRGRSDTADSSNSWSTADTRNETTLHAVAEQDNRDYTASAQNGDSSLNHDFSIHETSRTNHDTFKNVEASAITGLGPKRPTLDTSPSSGSGSPTSREALRERRKGWSPDKLSSSIKTVEQLAAESASTQQISVRDQQLSPTPAAPKSGADLKGLVRTHLRQTSNVSSAAPSPGFRIPSVYQTANPWHNSDDNAVPPLPPIPKEHESDRRHEASAEPSNTREKVHHVRGFSSETRYERQAFATELAERQRAIQENLRIKVENESRSPSPLINNKNVFEHPFKTFNVLRAVSSRESLNQGQKFESLAKPYKWVDIPSTDAETISKGESQRGRLAREDSIPTLGRTLHSRLRDQRLSKAASIRVSRMTRPLSMRRDVIDRSSVLYRDAAAAVVPLKAPTPEKPKIQTHASSLEPASIQPHITAGTPRPVAKASDSSTGHLPTTPEMRNSRRASGATGKPLAPLAADPVNEQAHSEVVHGSPASSVTTSIHTQASSAATPSTVATSTFSTPQLDNTTTVASNTPKSNTTKSINTNSSQTQPQPQASTEPRPSPPIPQLPAMKSSVRQPLADIQASTYNARQPRKLTHNPFIKKSDISEPIFIASTSTVETVPLPEGASLKNGMAEDGSGDIDVVVSMGGTRGHWAAGAGRAGPAAATTGTAIAGMLPLPPRDIRKELRLPEEKEMKMNSGGKDGKEKMGFLAKMGRLGSGERKFWE